MAKLVKLREGQVFMFHPPAPQDEAETTDQIVNDLLDEVEELLIDHESVVIRLVNTEDK